MPVVPQVQSFAILRDMNLEFSGDVWLWKGPAPYHFVTVPPAECVELKAAASP